MPLLPRRLEVAFRCKDGEVDVAEVVRLAACKRAEDYEAEERRAGRCLCKLKEARPLAQTLGCAPPRPVVDLGHEANIFAQCPALRAAGTGSGLLVRAIRGMELRNAGSQVHTSRAAPSLERAQRVAFPPKRDTRRHREAGSCHPPGLLLCRRDPVDRRRHIVEISKEDRASSGRRSEPLPPSSSAY